MRWLTPLEVSKRRGCSKATVCRNIASGKLPAKRGKVAEADADAWEPKKRRPPKSDHTPEAKQTAAGSSGPEPAPPSEFQLAAQRLKIIEAARAERAWQREQGLLVEREAVAALLVDLGALLRTEVQSFTRRHHAEVMRTFGPVDGRRVVMLLERFERDFLARVVDETPRVLASVDTAGAKRKAS